MACGVGRFELIYQRLFNFWLVLFATVAGLKLYGNLMESRPLPTVAAGGISLSTPSQQWSSSSPSSLRGLSITPQQPQWLREISPREEERLISLLNRLSKQELMEVRGIGQVLAERIIAARRARDGFKRLAELMEVEGIGEKRARAIVSWMTERLNR